LEGLKFTSLDGQAEHNAANVSPMRNLKKLLFVKDLTPMSLPTSNMLLHERNKVSAF